MVRTRKFCKFQRVVLIKILIFTQIYSYIQPKETHNTKIKESNGNILHKKAKQSHNKNNNNRITFSKECLYQQNEFHFVNRTATLFNSRATTIFVHNQITTSVNCEVFFLNLFSARLYESKGIKTNINHLHPQIIIQHA